MTATTAINALRYPNLADAPNAQTAFLNLANDVDSRLVGQFATVTARNTAYASPVFGNVAAVSGTGELYFYNGTVWIGAKSRVIVKANDVSRTSNVTLADDSDPGSGQTLTVPVEANGIYKVQAQILMRQSVTSASFKTKWTIPAGATLTGMVQGNLGGGTDVWEESGRDMTATINVTNTSTNDQALRYEMILANSTNAGSLTFQWAQLVSTASNNTVYKYSYIDILKVG